MDIRNFFGSAPKQSKKKEKATSQNGSKSTEATSEGGEDGRREHGDDDVGESLTTSSRSRRRTSPRKRRGPPPKYDDDGHDDDHDYEDGDDHDDDHDDKARRRGTRRGTPDDEEEVAIVEKKKTVKRRIVIESDSDDEGAAKEGEEEQEKQEEKQQQEEEEDEEQHQQQQRDEFDTPTKQHRTHRIPSKLHESSPPKYHPPSSILSAHLPFLSHSLSKTHHTTHCDTARFSLESATPLCLSGLTFVFSGILTRGNNHHGADRRVLDTNARVSIASPTKGDYYKNRHFEVDDAPLDEGDELPRETAVEAVKMLGGRVTSAVSGKTDYLIAGNVLEDGRRVEEGSKYKKVLDLWEAWGDKHRGEYERNSEDEEDDEEENDRPRKKTAKTAKATKAKAKTNAKTAKDRDPNSLVEIVRGVDEFYGLISFLSEWKKTTLPPEERDRLEASQRQLETQTQSKERRTGHATSNTTSSPHTATASSTPSKATPPAKAIVNPYAKKAVSNPYASSNKSPSGATTSVTNPYAKKAVSNPYAKAATTQSPANGATKSTPTANMNDFTDAKGNTVRNALWADKYAPVSSRDILGNGDSVGKLARWLSTWETTWNSAQNKPKNLSAPKGPWKAALLSGPPGIGKTTTATLIAKESDRDVLELNASDARSKKALTEALGDVTGSQVLRFGPPAHSSHSNSKQTHKYKSKPPPPKRRCIIMDEVDGMGAGDRSGMAELLQMIKHSKVPIICICNDRSSPKVRSLAQYCLDLKFRRPTKTIIAKRAVEIGRMEGMHIEPNAAEAVAESCGNDIRQVLNCLQMWSCKKNDGGVGASTMTYKDLKDRQMEINKDEVLRVNIFDACKLIVEGSRGLAGADTKAVTGSLIKRTDAFFVDYMLMGLNVHQNYLKVSQGQFNDAKKKGDSDLEVRSLEHMHDATLAMSDFGVCEEQLRGGDQNWALLPLCSVLAVKVGHHAGGPNGGFLPGYPEFAGWLGKNSSRGKKMRLLQELRHHMNYRVSADAPELRMTYIPIIRQQFESLLFDKEGAKVKESIDLMDEYGLDRDDVFENLDEFLLASAKGVNRFGDLNSNVKAAVTRVYNQTAHTSQALVAEQGAGKSSRRKGGAASSVDILEGGELDVVDDDKVAAVPDDDEGEDEDDLEELKSLFKKKGGKRSSAASKNGSGGGGGGKRAKKK